MSVHRASRPVWHRALSAIGQALSLPPSWLAVLGLALAVMGPAMAQDDPPGRVGRLVDVQGSVAWWDAENGQWADAVRNRPLTALDRISTSAGSRAEIRVGSVVARLGPSTELEVRRLDDDAISLQLHSGSLALRIHSAEVAAEVDVVTREARALPLRSGHYRFDRLDDTTSVAVWRGELQIEEVSGGPVTAGQRLELTREARRGGGGSLEVTGTGMPDDAFGRWVLAEDAREQRTASSRFVSPEMTGAEDLDRFGRWTEHPEFGAIWFPTDVRDDWAPYREGRWAWVAPWGWTWIDDARWGFAPFHYGRWVFWRGGWGWVPGAVVARPVYAPGLVAWVGVPDGGGMGWLPLAPREVYRPHYRVTPRYLERINVAPRYRWDPEPAQPRRGGRVYGNQAVPGAVTLMPTDTPIGRPQRDRHEGPGPRQFAPGTPPPPPPHREAGPEAQPRQPAPTGPQVPHPHRYLSPPAPAMLASPVPAVGPAPALAPAPAPAPAGRPGPAPASPPVAPPPRIKEPAAQLAPVMPPAVLAPAADSPLPPRQTVNPRGGSRQPTPPPPAAPSPSLPPAPPPPPPPSHSPAHSPSPAPAPAQAPVPAAAPPTAPARSDAPATPAPKGAPPDRAPRGEGDRNEERKPRAEPRSAPRENLPKENLH